MQDTEYEGGMEENSAELQEDPDFDEEEFAADGDEEDDYVIEDEEDGDYTGDGDYSGEAGSDEDYSVEEEGKDWDELEAEALKEEQKKSKRRR